VIGAGPITDFHVRALLDCGFRPQAVAARPGSIRASELATRFGFLSCYGDWREVLDQPLDALAILTPPEPTPEILTAAMQNTIGPILVEKPVSLKPETVERLADLPGANRVLVGYNRRCYSSTEQMSDFLDSQEGPLTVTATVPELSTTQHPSPDMRARAFLSNTVHILDLLLYLFPGITVGDIIRQEGPRGVQSLIALVQGDRNGAPISGSLTVTFGVPGNFRIQVTSDEELALMSPIEVFRRASDMSVSEPDTGNPIRTYTPKWVEPRILSQDDRDYKPGFAQQARVLRRAVDNKGGVPAGSATLRQAAEVLRLASHLLRG